jgi:Sulfotransferase family
MPSQADGGPPDFVGIGVAGRGPAWWLRMLVAHPEIRASRRRSLNFFDRYCAADFTDADVAAYHAHFPRVAGTICGEWTGRYVLDAWTPPLLARAAPDAKLLVMVADPVQRYQWILADRRERFAEGEVFYMTDAVERACHATQLERLYRFFDPEQVLVLQFERCVLDRAGEYRRTLEFLGVRDRDRLPGALRHRPPGGGLSRRLGRLTELGRAGRAARLAIMRMSGRRLARVAPRLWPDVEEALHIALDPEIERLAELVPQLDLKLWPNFAHLT